MFRSVLVPLDGSEFAEIAVPWAVAATEVGATLHLVHAHSFLPPETGIVCDPNFDRALLVQENQYLDALSARVRALAPQLAIVPRNADVCPVPCEALGAAVQEARADLVVMATHRRGQLARLVLGSVACAFAKRSPVPVLLIPQVESAGPPERMARPRLNELIVALDGSTFAEQILTPAAALAFAFGCRCTLVCVTDPATDPTGERAEAYLQRVAGSGCGRIGCKVVRGGSAAETLLSLARGNPQVGIALATHGRAGIGRLLHGSVADEVIRHTAGPVLIMHPTGETADHSEQHEALLDAR